MTTITKKDQQNSIDELINLLGRKWVEDQVARHSAFKSIHSPRDLWSHRKPKVSPLIPAIYEYENEGKSFQQDPLGFWYGDPIVFLAQIAEQVKLFKIYWQGLPNGRGKKNLQKHLLRMPYRFSSFHHELTVATHYVQHEGFKVTPLFFDPVASKGKPDILIEKNGLQIGIQCKARSPIESAVISFDQFQYFAGRVIRFVEDIGESYEVKIEANEKLTQGDIEKAVVKTKSLLDGGLRIPQAAIYPKFRIHVRDLGVSPPGIPVDAVQQKVQDTPGNLFVVGAGLNKYPNESIVRNIALISVSGPKGLDFIPWILATARESAKSSPKDIPMWLTLHTFGNFDLEVEIKKGGVGDYFDARLLDILNTYRHIQRILLSSDHENYYYQGKSINLQTKVMTFDNPYFSSPV